MESLYDFDDIEAYVQGKMSEEDRLAFEASMAEDAALAAQVEALRLEPKVLQLLREEARRKQFAIWELELEAEAKAKAIPTADELRIKPGKKTVRLFLYAALAVAASILLLLLAKNLFHPFNNSIESEVANQDTVPPDTGRKPDLSPETSEKDMPERVIARQWSKGDYQKIADKYYQTATDFVVSRDTNNASDSTSRYIRAIRLYEQEKYREGLALLRNPDSAQLRKYVFLRARIAYKADSIDRALADFVFLQKPPRGQSTRFIPFKYEAQWGEVLCLVTRLPQSRQTMRTLLTAISKTTTHPYQSNAIQLLKEQALQDAFSTPLPGH